VFSGEDVGSLLKSLGVSHVVTVPDSTIGKWEAGIEAAGIRLVRVCREGEAWTIAGGLYLGGASPIVLIQCTGLFESGDALRNVLHEWKLPIYSIIGYRSYLNQDTLPGDTSLVFTEPILAAWNLDVLLVTRPTQLADIGEHYRECTTDLRPGVALVGEGKA